MAGRKKKQPAGFAKDKNAFADGSPAKGDRTAHKAKQKQPGAHQPRDADVTSGHDVQKPRQPETLSRGAKHPARKNGLKQEQPKTFGDDANHSASQNDLRLKNKPDNGSFPDNQNSFQSNTRKIT